MHWPVYMSANHIVLAYAVSPDTRQAHASASLEPADINVFSELQLREIVGQGDDAVGAIVAITAGSPRLRDMLALPA